MPKYELVITNDNELSPLKSTPLTLSVLELIGPQGIQGPEGPRGVIGVTNTGGDGSLEYDPITGIFTYTGPSADEVRGHFSSGTGVTITDGQISIGQSVATTDNVTFNNVTSNLTGDVTGTVSTLTNHDTDDLAEGTDNLYYTDGRAQGAISTDDTLDYNSGVVSMPNTGVTAAEYGSASQVPVITVDAQGRITSASETNVAGVTGFDYDTLTGVLDIDTADGGNFEATVTLDPFDTDDLSEGTDNLYYTDSRSRAAISVTEAGGDGSLAYNNTTGIITFTGPSADEVRDHFIAGDGVTITNGEIAIGQAVGTANSPQFTGLTLTGDLTVNGSTTTINTTNLAVQDSLIELSSGLTAAAGNDAGLIIERGTTGDNAFIGWDEAANKFTLGTTTATGTSTGSLAVTTGTLVADIEGDVTGDVTGSVTVGATKTLDVSAGTLTLADNQISGDKINGGTIDSVAIASADIDGGNIDGTVIGATTPAAISGTTGQFGTSLNVDGTITADGLNLGDNEYIRLGDATNGDLTISHDGTNSKIVDRGDGDLLIQGSTNVKLQNFTGSQDYLIAANNGPVTLHYSGNEKLATTSTGVSVTGSVELNGWTVTESGGSLYFATGGNNKMKLDASGNLQVVGNVESNATIS